MYGVFAYGFHKQNSLYRLSWHHNKTTKARRSPPVAKNGRILPTQKVGKKFNPECDAILWTRTTRERMTTHNNKRQNKEAKQKGMDR